ncbi:hypothetical protein RND71_016850 [Anisodus tanguticus]|uniref:DUF7890 domain-containing protein n=1 Tax=Anisodus tanguticus TaxID=243964 RepID=A0AAE1S9N9_9SOLA|nr:hypothetical protein RND71_016850 [Anisodus tanguticus]
MGFASFLLKGKRSNSKKINKVESSITNTTTTYVCRDELDKKKPKIKKQVKFDLESKCQYPIEEEISHEELKEKNTSSLEKCIREGVDDNANNNGVRVKILMKKKDAVRILLKCSEGGVLKFMDVAQELVQVPSSRVRVISSPNHNPQYGSFMSIPE